MKNQRLFLSLALVVFAVLFSGCEKKSYFEGTTEVQAAADTDTKEEGSTGENGTGEESPGEDSPEAAGKEPKDEPQEVIVKVYVYNETGAVIKEEVVGAEAIDKSGLLDINSATREELMTLSGIGEGKAEAIITYRQEHGRFLQVEELMQVSGIGESTFSKIKDKITV